jgi:glycosyltransferase involved in cell wall biosynthesis
MPSVREVIQPGETGLLEPLFDEDRLSGTALRVLDDPPSLRPLGMAGSRLIEEKYSLQVAIPELKKYFESIANQA